MIEIGKTGKPMLGVLGFLGRGNVGDEAIFQCIYEAFRDKFDIVVAVDEHGARRGWWDWYPYNELERIHQGNIHFFEKRLAGLIVGGGGLGLGFGASQVIVARGAGTPTAFAGTDHTHTIEMPLDAVESTRRYYDLFDYVSLRSRVSVEWARRDGIEVHLGADWAFNLVTDNAPNVPRGKRRAAVVFREFPQHMMDEMYPTEAARLIEGLCNREYDPFLLPLSPEDESFADKMGLSDMAPQEVQWWNARRVQQLIAESDVLVSVGRLHSMIFAANVGTRNIQIRPPLRSTVAERHFRKLEVMADELCVPYFPNVSDALLSVSLPFDTVHMEIAVERSKLRLKAMIAKLEALFVC